MGPTEGRYSIFKLFEGFVLAARMAWKLTVYRAINTASEPADKNTPMVMEVR